MYAIVRDISSSFNHCETDVDNRADPINIELAKKQHEAYVETLKKYVKHVIEVPEDPSQPDCCFVEDTAVVVEEKVIVNRLGAESRRKEVGAIEEALKKIPAIKEIVHMHEIDPQATLDGGDVLYTGKHLFVGLSNRTNQRGADVLNKVFAEKCPVYTIKSLVGYSSLHFKCIVSMLDDHTLIVTDHSAGLDVINEIKGYTKDWYSIIKVPEQIPSNILSLSHGKFAVYQEGFSATEKILIQELKEKRNVEMKSLCMSELIKADGALTCCSILIG
ncbi:hypothetical protein BY458DRAFT_515225 [Sporodiniella umbellata]|nr:hypothetical protein BY458DRAFT_515225 [Sporodiniella umbellata]